MKHVIMSIFDVKVSAFQRPSFSPTVPAFVRACQDEVNRPDSEMGKHPEDYQIFKIGEFDDESGLLVPLTPPDMIVVAVNLKRL